MNEVMVFQVDVIAVWMRLRKSKIPTRNLRYEVQIKPRLILVPHFSRHDVQIVAGHVHVSMLTP